MLDGTDLTIQVSDADHAIGPVTAPVTLVEYGDYECPDCLNSEPIIQQLRDHFGDQLRVIFRHFPQNSVHLYASAAAQAAEAAAAQGKFWEMHHSLFSHQKDLYDLDLTHLALTLGLDPYRFQRDSEAGNALRRVRHDLASGADSGVNATPTFFVNGCRYNGSKNFIELSARIQSVIDQK